MNMLMKPVVLVALGLILGVGTGLGWFLAVARPLLLAARVHQVAPAAKPEPEAPWGFWTVEIDNLAGELKDAQAVLKKREDLVATREARLAAELKELTKVRAQLESLRAEIGGRLVEVQADESKNLKTLAVTYSAVTPKSAIAIFREMDDQTVVKILSFMKSDVVSALFEEMAKSAGADPALAKRAGVLSEKLRLLRSLKTAAVAP